MTTLDTIDWSMLSAPLAGPERCGADLQYDAACDAVRRARQAEPDGLPAGVWERKAKKIDWEDVALQCVEILSRRSKDLQVAAWLAEALTFSGKAEGLSRGLSLFAALLIEFWDDVHPRLEDGDAQLRLRPLDWLLRECARWLNGPLDTPPENGAEAHWQSIGAELARIEVFLDEKIPGQGPSFRDILALVRRRTEVVAPAPQPAPADALDMEADTAARIMAPPASRAAAYAQLQEIAAYLARVEPHSPVPAVLEGVVAWRDARFEDLLARLPQGGPSVYELLKLFKQG